MTEDERIAQLFSFVLERGFVFERDYNKATDSSCTQIYRFKKDAANYFEYRVLSARERTSFPRLRLSLAKAAAPNSIKAAAPQISEDAPSFV